jgi:hypothetical protein
MQWRGEKGTRNAFTSILVILIGTGVLLWLINNFIPMAGSIKSILNTAVVIGVPSVLRDLRG